MADELDPRLEARLRDVLRHEAETLPFTLTAADLDVARRSRRPAGIRRLGVPVSILAAAAAVVIIVVAGSYLRPTEDVGAPTPNLLAADLDSYEELAKGISLLNGLVIARGEDLVGDTPENGLKETVIGAVPASQYLDIVFDCRGRSLSFGIRAPDGEFPGGAQPCDQGAASFTIPSPEVPGELVVIAPAGTVWRLVVGAAESPLAAGLASWDELAAASVLAGGEILAQAGDHAGTTPASPAETVIGSVGPVGKINFIADCRGDGSIFIGIKLGGADPAGASTSCREPGLLNTTTDAGAGGEIVVRADPGVVWNAVVVGTPVERLATFDELAAVATSATEIHREEQLVPDESDGTRTYNFLALNDLWNLEVAIACTGPGEVAITTSGGEDSWEADCSGEPTATLFTLLDNAAERAPDAALVATVPAGVAWRLIVFDRSADIATGPVVPQAAFPVTVLTTFDGMLTPTSPHSEQVGPVAAGSTIEVAFGCSTGAFTPTDPPTLVRVTVDGVTSELACLKSNVTHFVPAGQRVEIGLATERTVDLALEVRAFTPAQAGAVFTAPRATLAAAEGTSKAQGFTTCLLSFAIPGGASADEGCGPTAYRIPDARAVNARAGESLWLVPGIDWTITGAASITYVASSEAGNLPPVEPVGHPAATRPGVEGDFSIAPLPVGDWTLRIDVSGTLANGTTFTAEQLFRVIVEP